jgi:hypothetical protein
MVRNAEGPRDNADARDKQVTEISLYRPVKAFLES